MDQQTGDRLTAFRNAMEDHVSYIEVYAKDVRDPEREGFCSFSLLQWRDVDSQEQNLWTPVSVNDWVIVLLFSRYA